jgi:hypothetical protein
MGYTLARAAAPSDATDEPAGIFTGVYVGGAGNVVVVSGGVAVTFTAPPVGSIVPIRGSRINATGTTATALVVLYGGD